MCIPGGHCSASVEEGQIKYNHESCPRPQRQMTNTLSPPLTPLSSSTTSSMDIVSQQKQIHRFDEAPKNRVRLLKETVSCSKSTKSFDRMRLGSHKIVVQFLDINNRFGSMSGSVQSSGSGEPHPGVQ